MLHTKCCFLVGVGIIFFLNYVRGQSNFQARQLYEHDECNESGWTCQKARNCPHALQTIKEGNRPQTCSFDGTEPVVCCPRNDTETLPDSGFTQSKSSQRCSFYSQFLCFPPPPVIGGKPAKPKEFPHMALIGYGEDPYHVSWQCGGSLISERYVLSAAHCTFPSATIGSANYVRVGDLNTASNSDDARPQQFNIIERINHPEYKPPELYNDIALYKLDRNVTFDIYVRPVCLYESLGILQRTLVATGWGRLEFVGPTSTSLMKVNLTHFEAEECTRLLSSSNQLPRGIDSNSMLCAGERDGSRDTCQGDSGGPLILPKSLQSSCLATQVGVTSFGRQCGLRDSPGVYTSVSHYISWIESTVWPGDALRK